MGQDAVNWRDRFPGEVTCVRCLQKRSVEELDRLLWCDECQAAAKRRASIRGWLAGAALAVVLALYIWLVIQPDLSLIPTGWAATLAVAFYLGARVARELFLGWERLANRRAVEARPPSLDTDSGREPGDGRQGRRPRRRD